MNSLGTIENRKPAVAVPRLVLPLHFLWVGASRRVTKIVELLNDSLVVLSRVVGKVSSVVLGVFPDRLPRWTYFLPFLLVALLYVEEAGAKIAEDLQGNRAKSSVADCSHCGHLCDGAGNKGLEIIEVSPLDFVRPSLSGEPVHNSVSAIEQERGQEHQKDAEPAFVPYRPEDHGYIKRWDVVWCMVAGALLGCVGILLAERQSGGSAQ